MMAAANTIKFRRGQTCRSFDCWGRLTAKRWTVVKRVDSYVSRNPVLDRSGGTKRRPRVTVRLGKSQTFSGVSVRTRFGVEYAVVLVNGDEHRVVAKVL